MFCLLIVILIILILCLYFQSYYRSGYVTVCGGSGSHYNEALGNAWRVSLFSLKLRAEFNVFCKKMYNIREYLWQYVDKKSSDFIEPSKLIDRPPLLIHAYNRKFEGFFYTTAGNSKAEELFPYGKNLTANKLEKMFADSEYYNTKNVCKMPLEVWNEKNKDITLDMVMEAFRIHGYDVPDGVDIRKYAAKLFDDEVDKIIAYYHKLMDYKLEPLIINDNGKLMFKLKNPRSDIFKSDMIVEWSKDSVPYYPDLFRSRNSVNTKETGNSGDNDVNKLLAIITLSHMPVFTKTHFRGNVLSISKSPGLMTSPTPKINKQMRNLPWVVSDDDVDVPFWSNGSPPNRFLESYASPLNHNAEIFCSLFPTDRYANGCIGKFDETIVDRFKKYKWVPKITMANPPYANEQFFECDRLTDLIHKHYKTITVTTISRRDGTLFDRLMKEAPRPHSAITKTTDIIMKPMIESPYYWNMYVIPESTFVYADLFLDKEFSVSSRPGERPTDTILIIKTTDPDLSHVKEIEKLFVDGLPKNDMLRTEPEEMDDVIKDIEMRRDIQGIDPKIMDRKLIKNIIRNTNMMVSGRP